MQRPVLREKSVDPQDSRPHGPDHREDHRHSRASHPAKGARDQVHDAAQEIRHCSDRQDLQSALDHVCISCIDPEHLGAEYISTDSEDSGYRSGQDHTVREYSVHPLLFPHAVVLARKAHARLCDRIYGNVQESKDIICRCISCHRSRAERVDGRLEHRVGKIDHRALYARGYPHLEDPLQIRPFYGKL